MFKLADLESADARDHEGSCCTETGPAWVWSDADCHLHLDNPDSQWYRPE